MLSRTEERIERSIFEAIRLVLVAEGYLPDIANNTTYPKDSDGDLTAQGVSNYLEDMPQSSVEVFGDSSQFMKGVKEFPRITINPTRTVPGDIGTNLSLGYIADETNPEIIRKTITDYNSVHLQYDIILTCKTAKEKRTLNAVLAKALGVRNFIKVYDSTTDEVFLIEQYGFYDSLADDKGIVDKTYSYQVKDIFITNDVETEPIALIKEIKIDLIPTTEYTTLIGNQTLIGPYLQGESIIMDLSGVAF